MAFIFTLLGGAIGRYLLIAAVALGALTWIRHTAAAPYKARVIALEQASRQKDAIIAADAERRIADDAEKTRLAATLEEMLNDTAQNDGCKLSATELDRLRKL